MQHNDNYDNYYDCKSTPCINENQSMHGIAGFNIHKYSKESATQISKLDKRR